MKTSRWSFHVFSLFCCVIFCQFAAAQSLASISCSLTDIDQDNDGLIEICDVEGINEIRYQPDGTGYRSSSTATKITLGCRSDDDGNPACVGYELTKNLDFRDSESYRNTNNMNAWSAGLGWSPISSFDSILEGNGYTISNLHIDNPSLHTALIEQAGNNTRIQNIRLSDVNIGGNHAAALIHSNSGAIVNSSATGSVFGTSHIGGLVSINHGSITGGYTEIDITLHTNRMGSCNLLGGLAAVNEGTVADSYARGQVSGSSCLDVGGLVGTNKNGGVITNSYATGNVTGSNNVGGLVGHANLTSNRINNSYATGRVKGQHTTGGLVGRNAAKILNSYAAGKVRSNRSATGGLVGINNNLITNSYYAGSSVRGVNGIGGLVGNNADAHGVSPRVINCYASGKVNVNTGASLIGNNDSNSTVINSYAINEVRAHLTARGLVLGGNGQVLHSYWNIDVNPARMSAGGASKTTAELQSPIAPGTTATQVYFGWGTDDWDFGDTRHYPLLKYTAGPDGDACDTDAATTLPHCGNLLGNQRNKGLSALSVLSSDEILDNDVILDRLFSSRVTKYNATIPYTDTIRLIPYAVVEDGATISVSKEGDQTNTDYFADKRSGESSALIPLPTTMTTLIIRVTNNSTVTYTFRIHNSIPPPSEGIGVVAAPMSNINEDGTVDEGNTIILVAGTTGDISSYRYSWEQTAGEPLLLTEQNTSSTLSVHIPENFLSADDSTGSVTFTLTIEDMIAVSLRKAITINKIDNGTPDITLEVSTSTLSIAAHSSDPDGVGTYDYLWQVWQSGHSGWMDISTAASYTVPMDILGDIRYRVQVMHTDRQGYTTDYAGSKSFILEPIRMDIDDDNDGLIDIYYLEDLDAVRYQLDGTAYNTSNSTATKITRGCPTDVCSGYELRRSLDFEVAQNYLDAAANQAEWTVANYADYRDLGWQPLSNGSVDAFSSVFKGNYHTISNLQIDRDAEDHVALFGRIAVGAKVDGVGLLNTRIEGRDSVGTLVGTLKGRVINSYVSGGNVKGTQTAGGLVGTINAEDDSVGIVINSYADINVEADEGVSGGLAGRNLNRGIISNSFAVGNVTGHCDSGGLVGLNADGSEIVNSYAIGNITADDSIDSCTKHVAGLVGNNRGGIIRNSYTASVVSGIGDLGGLVALSSTAGTITDSYWDVMINPDFSRYGTPKGTDELQTPTDAVGIYENWSTADWDFGDAQSYPALRYAKIGEDIQACDSGSATEIPPCGGLLAGQRNSGLSMLFLFSQGEKLDNGLLLDKPFSSLVYEYDVTVLNINEIQLRPYAINSSATLVIKKQGDLSDIDYLDGRHSGDLSTSISLTEAITTLTIVVTDVATTTYTFVVNKVTPLSVSIDTDDTADEGDTLSLRAQIDGGAGSYRYRWTQIPAHSAMLSSDDTAVANARISENFVARNATTRNITFILTVEDDFYTASYDKTVTITKVNNENPDSILTLDGLHLGLSVEDDSDGNGVLSDYQWQKYSIDSLQWINTTTTSVYIVPEDASSSARYRVRATYTDGQGYVTEELSEALRVIIDDNNDGLIDIYYLEDLNAVRYQPDGTGYNTSNSTATKITRGCPDDACSGYELRRSLDFEVAHNYLDAATNQGEWTVDDYMNNADSGWLPIGTSSGDSLSSVFKGNYYTISNLQINRDDANNIALFGFITNTARLEGVGLIDVRIEGERRTSSLVGDNRGIIINSYVNRGNIIGVVGDAGGLAGHLNGQDGIGVIVNSYAMVDVESRGGFAGGLVARSNTAASIINSYAVGNIRGPCPIGGLVGYNLNGSQIINSYAGGSVISNGSVNNCTNYRGGLVGSNLRGIIKNSYTIARLSGVHNRGGLVGRDQVGTITDSYWDRNINPVSSSHGSPRTTVELQTPTDAVGIYQNWSTADWYFGSSEQYPTLKYTMGNDQDNPGCENPPPDTELPNCRSLVPAQYAFLDSLVIELSNDGTAYKQITLSPIFESAVYSYSARLGKDAVAVRLTPTANSSDTISYTIGNEDGEFQDLAEGASIELELLPNITTVAIKVTPQNTSDSSKTKAGVYIIELNRIIYVSIRVFLEGLIPQHR